MACFHPLFAFQLDDGKITFREMPRDGVGIRRSLSLPCGKCIGCRLVKRRSWAIRCMHEASLHNENSFLTLTYDDNHDKLSLDYSDFQSFIRRVRKKFGKVRFFMCGEYGDLTRRAHFHALFFWPNF